MNAITSTQPCSQSRHTATTTSNPDSIAVASQATIVRAANQIHDPNPPRVESDSNAATMTLPTVPTNSDPAVQAYLLQQDNHDEDYDPMGDRRFEEIITGFNLYFRFFEVRANLEFRHCRERFDPSGFLCLSWQSFDYTDDWWDSVTDKDTRITQDLLVGAGILEFKEVDTQNVDPHFRFLSFMRLRADRIALVGYDPDKYSFFKLL